MTSNTVRAGWGRAKAFTVTPAICREVSYLWAKVGQSVTVRSRYQAGLPAFQALIDSARIRRPSKLSITRVPEPMQHAMEDKKFEAINTECERQFSLELERLLHSPQFAQSNRARAFCVT